MKKTIFNLASVGLMLAVISCKKDTCTIGGQKITCDEVYGGSCSKIELAAFKSDCKNYGGSLSTK